MKKSTKKLISLISAGLIVLQSIPFMAMGSFAAEAEGEALKYTPTLDGVKDDAYNASYSYTETMSVGDWTFSFLYDDSYIYVYADIADQSKGSLFSIAMSMHETIEGNWQAFQATGSSLCYLVSNPFLTGYEIRHWDNPAGSAGWKNIGSNLGWQNTPANGVEGEYVKEGTTSPATEYGLVVGDAGCALEFRVAYTDIDSTGKVSFAVADNVGATNAYGQLWGADNIAVDNAAFTLGAEYDTTHVHKYDEAWTVDVAATCLAAGSESRHCADYATCGGYTDAREIPATGHIFTDGVCVCGVLETAVALKYTPAIDGNLEPAWLETYSYALDTSKAYGLWNEDATEAWTASGSVVSGTAYYLYDDGYIYIAADIKDSTLAAMADNWQALNDGNNLHWADTVVFSIYNNANVQNEAVGITVGPMNDYAYAPNKNGTGMGSNWEATWTKATDTNNSEYAVSTYEGGYIVELRVAATTLAEGTTYGVDLGVWDGVDHTINVYGGITSVYQLGTLWTGARLGTFVLGEEYVDVHTHTWTDVWETVTEPTCTEVGKKVNKCVDYDTCFGVQEEEIAALGHTWATETAVDVAPTCTAVGSESIHCTACGASDPETAVEIAALGHTWADAATQDRAATCYLTGLESVKCLTCGLKDESTIVESPALGHNYVDGACSVCGVAAATHTVNKGTPVLDGQLDEAYVGSATLTTLDLIALGDYTLNWSGMAASDTEAWTTAGIPTSGSLVAEGADYTIPEFAKAESSFLWDENALYIFTKVYDDNIYIVADEYLANVGADTPWINDVVCHTILPMQNIYAPSEVRVLAGGVGIWPDANAATYTAVPKLMGSANTAEYVGATVNTEEGYYTVEVKIPFSANTNLGDALNTIQLKKGATFGYKAGLIDGNDVRQNTVWQGNEWSWAANANAVNFVLSDHEHVAAEDYTVDVEATCMAAGSKSIHCTECGEIIPGTEVVIEKLDHSMLSEYDETSDMYIMICENEGCDEYHEYIGEVTKEATCGDGEKVYTCYACDEAPHINEGLTETLWGTGEHTFENDTCTVCGYTRVLGAWDYPYELAIGGTRLAVTVNPGETAYINASEVDGSIVTIGYATHANFMLMYGRGQVALAEDGTGSVTLSGYYQLNIYNPSEEAVVVYMVQEAGAAPEEGTMDNPKVIDLGTYSVDLAAGNSGYYYQYTATADGNVVFTMDTADAWFYVINIAKADGSYVYGDNQWSDSDPVAATQTLELTAGDVVTINVATYNAADMWNAPAGTITITLAEEVVEDPCADGHTLGATSGGIKTCTVCGYVSNLRVGAASVTLEADLTVNIKVRKDVFDGAGYTNPYVVATKDGVDYTLTEYVIDGNYYVFALKNFAPRQMGDTYTAVVHGTLDGVDIAGYEVHSYSITAYLASQFSRATSDAKGQALKTLIADLLVYGYEHQLYNDYNVDSPVTAAISAEDLATYATATTPELTSITNAKYEVLEGATAAWKSASISLKASIEINAKFTVDSLDGVTVEFTDADGNVLDTITEFEAEGDRYVAKFTKLRGSQLSDALYAKIYKDGVLISNTLQYSVESYAAGKLNDATVGSLCAAIMKYGYAAVAYFAL